MQGAPKCKGAAAVATSRSWPRPSELYCLSCTCGKWSVKGSSICSACAAGRFRTNVEGNGPMSCSPATLGQQPVLNVRQVACSQKSCPAGRYQDEVGQPNCKACPKGTFNMDIGSTASSACLDCKPGRWAGRGAPRCTACEAGRVSNVKALATKSGCGACQAGHYAASAAMTSCVACENGRFVTTEAATQCTQCPQGTANGNIAATSLSACVACAAGQFQPAMDSAKCKSCTFGTYQDEQGQIDCKLCARGYANGATGSTRADACVACKWDTTRMKLTRKRAQNVLRGVQAAPSRRQRQAHVSIVPPDNMQIAKVWLRASHVRRASSGKATSQWSEGRDAALSPLPGRQVSGGRWIH